MGREVRYCTTDDGVRIAYCVEGDGPPLLVLPIFVESFSLDHLFPSYRQFLASLGPGRAVVRFDPREVGLSQKGCTDVTYPVFLRDLDAVVSAVGMNRVSILAPLVSGPAAIQYAVEHPSRVSRLILYETFVSLPEVYPADVLRGFIDMSRGNWELASQILADQIGRKEFPQATLDIARWYRESITGEACAKRIEANMDWSVDGLLDRISCPTLVLHRVAGAIYPLLQAEKMAARIPGARLIPLNSPAAFPGIGSTDEIVSAINAFLDEDPVTRRSLPTDQAHVEGQGAFRTVLFTDLVGHTAMMRRLGDEKGRAVLRQQEAITRNVLKEYGGAEVKTMGDGFMASFPSVTRAVECAIALQKAFGERNEAATEPLTVRVGLNAGEPIEEDGDLFGEMVILAARIAAMAKGGEILASMAVRELCAGKGFLFADMGEHAMRGFEDPVHVFEIKRRE